MNRNELEKYITESYNADADFPWVKYPDYEVFRHRNNRKWFALIMNIDKSKLGLKEEGTIDVVNLKCEPAVTGSLRLAEGIFPAYHMNKESWITIALDESVPDEKIKALVDISFELTAVKVRKNRKKDASDF